MRIIAGVAGGVSLQTPKGGKTRPTSDRVREALFSRLEAQDRLRGALVLDLFAGSGALGLEAVSRGAQGLVSVDNAAAAVAAVKANVVALRKSLATHGSGSSPEVLVFKQSVEGYLQSGEAQGPFDLVFCDPPYPLSETIVEQIVVMVFSRILAPGGLLVVERSSRSAEPLWPQNIETVSSKRYGETVLWFATAAEADE